MNGSEFRETRVNSFNLQRRILKKQFRFSMSHRVFCIPIYSALVRARIYCSSFVWIDVTQSVNWQEISFVLKLHWKSNWRCGNFQHARHRIRNTEHHHYIRVYGARLKFKTKYKYYKTKQYTKWIIVIALPL